MPTFLRNSSILRAASKISLIGQSAPFADSPHVDPRIILQGDAPLQVVQPFGLVKPSEPTTSISLSPEFGPGIEMPLSKRPCRRQPCRGRGADGRWAASTRSITLRLRLSSPICPVRGTMLTNLFKVERDELLDPIVRVRDEGVSRLGLVPVGGNDQAKHAEGREFID